MTQSTDQMITPDLAGQPLGCWSWMLASSAVAISLPPASVVADMQDAALLSAARSLLTASVVWHLAAFANCAHALIIGSKTGSSRGSLGRPRRVTVALHWRSTDATASICAVVGVAGSFSRALLIFACSLSMAWSQTSSEPVSGPVGAVLAPVLRLGGALVLRLGVALVLTGAVGALEPPLHPVSNRTTADATMIMPPREAACAARKRPAGMPLRRLFPVAVICAGVLPAGCVCITTSAGPGHRQGVPFSVDAAVPSALMCHVPRRKAAAWRRHEGDVEIR